MRRAWELGTQTNGAVPLAESPRAWLTLRPSSASVVTASRALGPEARTQTAQGVQPERARAAESWDSPGAVRRVKGMRQKPNLLPH